MRRASVGAKCSVSGSAARSKSTGLNVAGPASALADIVVVPLQLCLLLALVLARLSSVQYGLVCCARWTRYSKFSQWSCIVSNVESRRPVPLYTPQLASSALRFSSRVISLDGRARRRRCLARRLYLSRGCFDYGGS